MYTLIHLLVAGVFCVGITWAGNAPLRHFLDHRHLFNRKGALLLLVVYIIVPFAVGEILTQVAGVAEPNSWGNRLHPFIHAINYLIALRRFSIYEKIFGARP